MNCERAKDMLADALGNELTATDRTAFDEHLAGCDACRLEFASLTKTLGALRRLETVPPQASLPIGAIAAGATSPRFRLLASLARYAAVVALAFVAGFLARGGVKSDGDIDGPRRPGASIVGPRDDGDLTTRSALAFAHRRNPHANQLAKLMMALHARGKN